MQLHVYLWTPIIFCCHRLARLNNPGKDFPNCNRLLLFSLACNLHVVEREPDDSAGRHGLLVDIGHRPGVDSRLLGIVALESDAERPRLGWKNGKGWELTGTKINTLQFSGWTIFLAPDVPYNGLSTRFRLSYDSKVIYTETLDVILSEQGLAKPTQSFSSLRSYLRGASRSEL